MKGFWKNKRVLITGHTGFKGSWLSLWLKKLGAQVIGYALIPNNKPNLFESINLKEGIVSIEGNILDINKLQCVFEKYRPEIVFHLAAQPLVRKSYINPIETFQTNVIGTVNLLEVIRKTDCVKSVVNVTSDKCYENKEWHFGYREIDAMGGYDPYSCSKGCSELITNSFRKSYLNNQKIYLASARAGNVIGGGDWAEERLVPDIIKFLNSNEEPVIRKPEAIRPWQHVLEPLYGYMLLAYKMWKEGLSYAEAWNFGPDSNSIISVSQLTNKLIELWTANNEKKYNIDFNKQFHEANFLRLDSSKAKYKLGWHTRLTIEEALTWTVDWYKAFYENRDMAEISLFQIKNYEIKGDL